MDRKGRYLKPVVRATSPRVLFTAVVETINRSYNGASNTTVREFGSAAVTLTKYDNGKWSKTRTVELDTPESFREWIQEKADRYRTNYVVCPTATEVLTLADYWRMFDAENLADFLAEGLSSEVRSGAKEGTGTVLGRFVVRGKPDIVEYWRRGKRFIWLSGFQYFASGPGVVQREPLHRAAQGSLVAEDSGDDGGGARGQAEAWAEAVKRLAVWWVANSKAPWGLTAGQLAMGMLRTYATPRCLCSHSWAEVHKLEREASYGGRASVWFVGDIRADNRAPAASLVDEPQEVPGVEKGPIRQVDCRAMYPSILARELFPTKLIGYEESVPASRAVRSAETLGVIARVTIRTTLPEYPLRSGEVVKYPIGQFTTTLTGPELLEVSKHGEVLRCHAMATYHLGKPFASTATVLLRMRREATSAQDAAAELLSKLIANSLGGKLAQRAGAWVRRSALDGIERWGEFQCIDESTGEETVRRFISGVCWEWKDDKDKVGPYQFAFCYLTAYGRLIMRRLRESLPKLSVVSQDTDGLWLLPAATEAIRALPGVLGENPGDFRLLDSASEARFFGPRHYRVDGNWTLAGFSQPVLGEEERTIWDTVEQSLWWSVPRSPPSAVMTHIRKCKFPLDIAGGSVDLDNWVRPPYCKPVKLDDHS